MALVFYGGITTVDSKGNVTTKPDAQIYNWLYGNREYYENLPK